MLTDEMNRELCDDIVEFYENYEETFLDIPPSEDDIKTYEMIVDIGHITYLPDCTFMQDKVSIIDRAKLGELRNEVTLYHDWYDIPKPKPLKMFYWLTLTGKDRIPDTPDTLKSMLEFGNALFNNNNYKRFNKVYWNIETGKHQDRPNLHLHALIVFENTSKNFHSLKPKGRSDVRTLWNNYFKQYGLDIGKDSYVFFKGKNIQQIYDDKLSYLQNNEKSILHKNYRDLEILNFLSG